MRIFNLIRDMTADAFGGWELVTMLQSGGGLAAQKIVSLREYDIEGARAMALREAGVTT
jgi:4-hydroxybutyryl-CoA dehydratase/vinylacetyl-CoA-Delta-isomerase